MRCVEVVRVLAGSSKEKSTGAAGVLGVTTERSDMAGERSGECSGGNECVSGSECTWSARSMNASLRVGEDS